MQYSTDIINPHQYAYNRVANGQDVNILKFDYMVRRFYTVKQLNTIEQICKVTNHIAVSTNLLKRSQRERYRENRIYESKNTYYLFKKDEMPFDIMQIVKSMYREDVYIYNIEN